MHITLQNICKFNPIYSLRQSQVDRTVFNIAIAII